MTTKKHDLWERLKTHAPPDNELNQRIALEIAAKRKAIHVSRDDLAERLKVSRACVARMESGRDGFKVQTIKRICDALDCTLSEFFSSLESNSPTNTQNSALSLDEAVKEICDALESGAKIIVGHVASGTGQNLRFIEDKTLKDIGVPWYIVESNPSGRVTFIYTFPKDLDALAPHIAAERKKRISHC